MKTSPGWPDERTDGNTGQKMDLFSWLLVGHMVGDWMFQNHWMAVEKNRGPASFALCLHCLIYTGAVVLALASVGAIDGATVWVAVGVVFLSHWLIDGFQLAVWWGKLIRQTDNPLVKMSVDQTFHLLVLFALGSWLVW